MTQRDHLEKAASACVCVFCSGRLGDSALKVAHTVIKLAVVSLASSQMSLTLPPISTHTHTHMHACKESTKKRPFLHLFVNVEC